MDKSFESATIPHETTAEDLELINRFTRKELKAEDVFTFSVILCDNEIDRDGERFDNLALEKLKDMFVGITGIFDHNHSGKNQTARIFKTEVIAGSTKTTSYGDAYRFLKAKAYMPRTEGNQNLIAEIDAGIKKEVSVCCSVKSYICSVCGNDMRSEKCNHIKGIEYSGKMCHCILKDPADAYEWSFVAVPAQVGAGVVKSYPKSRVTKTFSELYKRIKKGTEIIISHELSKELGEKLASLEKAAAEGESYRNELTKETVKYAALALKGIDIKTAQDMCKSLDIERLKKLRDSFFERAGNVIPLTPQLKPDTQKQSDNNQFIF
ncbi:MAG: hypothetical protein IJZ88_00950 [Clostridia bacterium]|nr:hypothetical protein [Clostridia bacterium]